jgi:hypothetical protein
VGVSTVGFDRPMQVKEKFMKKGRELLPVLTAPVFSPQCLYKPEMQK